MPISNEMRRLVKKWQTGQGWPKKLKWIEIHGLRGWVGQRIDFSFPIVAIVGENGSGKSTVLQAAASIYRAKKVKQSHYASEFFPSTAWDMVSNASVKYGYAEGGNHSINSIRKPTTRWLGNVDRPIRDVEYIDLSRIQPVSARVGYAKIAKTKHKEISAKTFDQHQVKRLSSVLGRNYNSARMALSDIDKRREVPVISKGTTAYSGFHQGSGETTIAELLQADLPKYGLVLIDEIESSLHPRAQRRLIRDLAERCRDREVQIILTTHSPYVLEELPLEARLYILETDGAKSIVAGVSPQFAMTKMDDQVHPECDLYVEDNAAKVFLGEILAVHGKNIFIRCSIVPFGASTVGLALGQMVEANRFTRPTLVFLDGDSDVAPGCILLPGEDAPEQVVFEALRGANWLDLWVRVNRDSSVVADACGGAMTLVDHHEWVNVAANHLRCSGATLWQSMCAEWAMKCLSAETAAEIVNPIENKLP
ncbi:MAG TPA: AAA family ATPase [Gammaproteobacteria bacterium]|nr:AAA family ATPase [Gammaproteobacteria bacterium]